MPEVVRFRAVPGFPGYRVGSDGSVWSRWRHCPYQTWMSQQWKMLKPSPSKKGYTRVNLVRDGKSKTTFVHSIVLRAFVGPCPEGMEARHLNSKPADNRLSNLQWTTPEVNRDDIRDLDRYGKGSKHSQAKLTEDIVRSIRADYSSGKYLQRELAEKHDVCGPTVSNIIRWKTWTHVT